MKTMRERKKENERENNRERVERTPMQFVN